MLLQRTRKRPARLLALLPIALLTNCADERPAIAPPPADRLEPVSYPAIPAGEAICEGKPCLSDREAAGLIADFANALDQANARILWLRDWAAGMAR